MIRIDAAWLATAPLDMRAGTDTALAQVVAVFGAAHPHTAYPCRDTLSVWLDELHPETRNHVVGKAQVVQRPAELKQAAIIELCTRQISAREMTQKPAVSRPTFYKWENQQLGPEAPAFMKRPNDCGTHYRWPGWLTRIRSGYPGSVASAITSQTIMTCQKSNKADTLQNNGTFDGTFKNNFLKSSVNAGCRLFCDSGPGTINKAAQF